MARTPVVVLHVGVAKSGTTFLQRTLAEHAAVLSERGVLYPQTEDDVMFRAALDVRGTHKVWGRSRSEVEGSWDELCRRARGHDGVTVISHELLGSAGTSQVAAALSMLRGLEVHVVVTARDPARQLTAEWQEGVKHGRRATFAEFQARVDVALPHDGLARHFHTAQDLPVVLTRWGHGLPSRRVHVVVGAPSAAPVELLRQRFAEAAGCDAYDIAPSDVEPANRSLGSTEVDLLRRVNVALDGRLPQPHYGRLVKHRMVRDVLAGRGSDLPVAPASAYDAAVHLGELWGKEIRRAGYSVHGDLDDLVPAVRHDDVPHPDDVDRDQQVEAASEVIADLLLRLHQTQDDLAHQTSKRRSWKKQTKILARRLADHGG